MISAIQQHSTTKRSANDRDYMSPFPTIYTNYSTHQNVHNSEYYGTPCFIPSSSSTSTGDPQLYGYHSYNPRLQPPTRPYYSGGLQISTQNENAPSVTYPRRLNSTASHHLPVQPRPIIISVQPNNFRFNMDDEPTKWNNFNEF